MSCDKSEQAQLGDYTEIIALREQEQGEKDYPPDAEGECWCSLHEDLPKNLGLRFLVRSIKRAAGKSPVRVMIGGIRVTDTLIVGNEGTFYPEVEPSSPEDSFNELHYLKGTEEESGEQIYIINRCRKARKDKCRLQFQLQVGHCFEFQFEYGGQNWAGHVELLSVEEERDGSRGPTYLVAKFAVHFDELEEGEAGEEGC